MYDICYVTFFLFEKPLVKNTFFKSPPPPPPKKNAQIVKLKYPDLDLIRRIQPECGFYGFMIRFWICSQKAKSVFGLGNPDLNFPKKRKLRRMITTTTRNKQHGSKQTNYNLQAWHFEPAEENTRFPRGPLQWVTEAKKVNGQRFLTCGCMLLQCVVIGAKKLLGSKIYLSWVLYAKFWIEKHCLVKHFVSPKIVCYQYRILYFE